MLENMDTYFQSWESDIQDGCRGDIWIIVGGSSVQIKEVECSEAGSSVVKPMSALLLSFHCPILANCAVGRLRPLPPPASSFPPASPPPPLPPPHPPPPPSPSAPLAPLSSSFPANESWEG